MRRETRFVVVVVESINKLLIVMRISVGERGLDWCAHECVCVCVCLVCVCLSVCVSVCVVYAYVCSYCLLGVCFVYGRP